MGKRAYISDGNNNWIPLVSSLPNMDAYATTAYVDANLSNIDLSEYLTIQSASAEYLTISNATNEYEKNIPYSETEPSSPSQGDLWVDSSTTPPALKTYNGSSWVQLGSAAAVDDAQAVYAGRMFA